MTRASILVVCFAMLALVGCSGSGSEPAPTVGDVATSPTGAAQIEKNGIPKPSGSVPDVNK